jgi:uncharacterized protein (DUF2147 family)
MRHYASAAVIGLLTAAVLSPVAQSHAASADPTGYWMKPDAERESKIQVFKCGSKKTNLCAKIAWIKDPNDSKGNPLHDVRNENPSMRGRQILGLAIFSQLVPSAPSTWTGKIYNPEDGRTYSATLTVVSRKQILLKGCKAWLLCGERNWYRTSAPPADVIPAQPADGTQQIEASVTPELPSAAPPSAAVAVAAEPAAPSADAPVAKASIDAAAAQDEMQAMAAPQAPAERPVAEAAMLAPATAPVAATPAPAVQEIATPAEPPADVDAGHGYGFIAVATDPKTAAPQSGENVSNMMLMAKPIPSEAVAPSTAAPSAKKTSTAPAVEPAPLPVARPKAQPKPVATAAVKPAAAPAAKPVATPAAKPVATAAAKPAPKPETQAKPVDQAALPPQEGETTEAAADGAETVPAETAEATLTEPVPLTRRERRLLRKQQRELEQGADLPWLR